MKDKTNPKDLIGSKKVPISLIPPTALIYLAMAMKNGADKYGPYNYREYKVQAMIYADAALRHLLAWIDGEDNAEDTGISHLAHMMACGAILLDTQELDNLIDNRPVKGKTNEILKRFDQSKKSQPLKFEMGVFQQCISDHLCDFTYSQNEKMYICECGASMPKEERKT